MIQTDRQTDSSIYHYRPYSLMLHSSDTSHTLVPQQLYMVKHCWQLFIIGLLECCLFIQADRAAMVLKFSYVMYKAVARSPQLVWPKFTLSTS